MRTLKVIPWVVLFIVLLVLLYLAPVESYKSSKANNIKVLKLKAEGYWDEWYGQNNWQCTAFFIRDNILMTCAHCVQDVNSIVLEDINGKEIKVVDWYYDELVDIGILEVNTPEVEKSAEFYTPETGDVVFSIGNPIGIFPILTKGIVSGTVRDEQDDNLYIVTDCALNPGNSGSPIFNKNNKICGMCSASYLEAQGMNLLVPANTIKLAFNKYLAIKLLRENR